MQPTTIKDTTRSTTEPHNSADEEYAQTDAPHEELKPVSSARRMIEEMRSRPKPPPTELREVAGEKYHIRRLRGTDGIHIGFITTPSGETTVEDLIALRAAALLLHGVATDETGKERAFTFDEGPEMALDADDKSASVVVPLVRHIVEVNPGCTNYLWGSREQDKVEDAPDGDAAPGEVKT